MEKNSITDYDNVWAIGWNEHKDCKCVLKYIKIGDSWKLCIAEIEIAHLFDIPRTDWIIDANNGYIKYNDENGTETEIGDMNYDKFIGI